MRNLAACALLIALNAASAMAADGIAYKVQTTRSADVDKNQTYTVVTSGDRARASVIDGPSGEGVVYDVLLRADRSGIIALNTRNRTWYELEPANPFALNSRFLDPVYQGKARKVRVRLDPPVLEPPQRHYSGEISYEVHISYGRNHLKVSCVASFQVSTTDAFDRGHWLGPLLPETGHPAVDAEMRKAEASIAGFPVQMSLDAQRTYEGGPAMHEMVRIAVTDIRETAAEDAAFVRPADYREQKPVRSAAGVE